jgi:ribosomal protein S18 acetylase RimI-like enzyme
MPFSDESLARRLEGVANRFMLEWLEGTGAKLERFGGAVAAVDPLRPELDFVNRVYGLWPEDKGRAGDIAAFYREHGVRGWLELAPSETFEHLAAALAEVGAAHTGFHTVLYGRPLPGERAEIAVERAQDPKLFADVLLRGHGVPDAARARDLSSVRRWTEIDGWHLYLARVDGEPAGAALLVLEEGLAYLANASTLPEFRRRGVQTALIAARIADARAAGCEEVCSGTAFGSASQRNLERAGFAVAYTKAVWRFQNPGLD